MDRVDSNSSRRLNVLHEIIQKIYSVRLHIKFPKYMLICLSIRFHESGQVRHKIRVEQFRQFRKTRPMHWIGIAQACNAMLRT